MPEMSVARCLLAVIVGLLLVGLASHTPLRHVVQVAPGAVALARRRVAWARDAALAVFAFWLVIMQLIWLFLLGLADVVTGHFTTVEILLTVLVGVASLAGIGAALRGRSSAAGRQRALAVLGFAVAQVGAMWLSLQPWLEAR